MSGLVAIHQPNFFPWLGYFDKLRRADCFIFLDQVAYPRAGSGGMGSWTNRVRIAVQGEPRWVTCPVRRMQLGSSINAAEIDDSQPWRAKLLKTLETNYRRAAHYVEAMAFLEPLIRQPESNLVAFNMNAIQAIAARLDISATLLRQSELSCCGRGTNLLISLVRAADGHSYLAGGGAGGYQEDDLFATEGLRLVYQCFVARPYGPRDRFIPGLSVIDYLMHDGRPLTDVFPDLPHGSETGSADTL
jgi:hypothetical protein